MLYALLDGRVDEPSREDGAMYNFLRNGNYIFDGIGNNFAVSNIRFNLTLSPGEGVICGHHVTEKVINGARTTQTLSPNSSGYVVIRYDSENNQALFTTTSTIANDNINDGGEYNDLVLYGYSTDSNAITTWVDMRPITEGNGYYLTIENGDLYANYRFNGEIRHRKLASKDVELIDAESRYLLELVGRLAYKDNNASQYWDALYDELNKGEL